MPLSADAELAPLEPRACDDDAPIAIGPGCAAVFDDRAVITPPTAPLLWTFAGLDRVVVSEPDRPFLLDALPVATAFTIELVAIDRAGIEHPSSIPVTTLPPMAHVILNEVLANPVGEEPQQEWVELYNDGLAPAQLGGWQLEDVGGEAPLPDVTLPPGGFALVVNETFDAESEWDPMPPPNVPLLRVPELGKNGLSNSGEPMRLRNALGAIVSRFPAQAETESRSEHRPHPPQSPRRPRRQLHPRRAPHPRRAQHPDRHRLTTRTSPRPAPPRPPSPPRKPSAPPGSPRAPAPPPRPRARRSDRTPAWPGEARRVPR